MSTEATLRLAILAADGCMLSYVAGAADALRVAQRLAELRNPASAPRFESEIVSARGPCRVRASGDLEFEARGLPARDPHVVLVPGLMYSSAHELSARLDAMTPEIEYLRAVHLRGAQLAGSCSGTFLLARTGLLDGRRATTSWWLAAAFSRYYPSVRLDADQMLVEDGNVITTGGATAVFSLVLRLIAKYAGEDLAQQTGRMLLVDPDRQSQAPYVSQAMLERPRNSLTERVERVLGEELEGELSIGALAQRIGTSERSLLRHFRSYYGESPLAHIQRLRVERAKALLESTHLSFDEIVERCGYRDVSSFRKLFKRATSITPGDYRERFTFRAR